MIDARIIGALASVNGLPRQPVTVFVRPLRTTSFKAVRHVVVAAGDRS